MKNVRYQRLIRLGTRGLELIQVPNPHPGLVMAGAPLPSAYQDLLQFMGLLRIADETVLAKTRRAQETLKALKREYDNARFMVVSAKVQQTRFDPSSQLQVAEDQLQNARELVGLLDTVQQHQWAKQILPLLVSCLDAAAQAREDELASRAALQKAQLAAHERADTLEAALTELRLAVRVVFGPSSREYQMIRSHRSHGHVDEPMQSAVQLPGSMAKTTSREAA